MPVLPAAAKTSPAVVHRPPVVETGGERPYGGAARREATGSAVRVRLSPDGREALVRSELAPRILDRVAEALGLETDALDAAGREEYLESIATPLDPRSEDTAEPILGGILSFVYDAFRLEHPDPSHEQVRGFVARALRGTERGMHDAMDLLRAFTARGAELEAESTHTLESVRAGLERFEARMRSIPASQDDEAGTPPSSVTNLTH
jgi:hypothetical protein